MSHRFLDDVQAIPPLETGFGGERHKAAPVIRAGSLPLTDPFFVMMDDNVTTAGAFGGAHPHAGLETVTFMLNGHMEDIDGRLDEGDVEWMTAGSGIVHNEDTMVSDRLRLFQLWLVLPERDRNMKPRVQILRRDAMPVHREASVEARVYSGRSGAAEAATLNAAPVTLVDIRLQPGAVFEQELPASYNGFVVGLEGDVQVGSPASAVSAGSVGWTHPVGDDGDSRLRFATGASAGRVLLYAGQPQYDEVVARGPFIAGSMQELEGYFRSYRQGLFPHAGELRAG